jgi:hypothetical protein
MLWIVAGSGPSLTEVVQSNVIAVNDAYRLCPNASVLYAADVSWWQAREGCPDFKGEKWTCTSSSQEYGIRQGLAKRFGIKIVTGRKGHGFSLDRNTVHYGGNSGFQAVNLALHRGANPIVLVGFDMRGEHFFGKHEHPLRQTRRHAFEGWCKNFQRAAEKLPKHIRIINATPNSALTCFPSMTFEEALSAN